jgi:hypothetical protein
MKSLELSRYALAIGTAAAMLAGCGGSQPPIGAPGAMPQSRAIAQPADRRGSWMLPGAKSEDLMYASDPLDQSVGVYTYPKGELVGTLTGFQKPYGLCSDKTGDVFVTDAYGHDIAEYAHGGTTPIVLLSDPSAEPYGCSIDPATNNLAVTSYQPPSVAIYTKAQGSPTIYTAYGYSTVACTYDNNSDLFISNYLERYLLELPEGGRSLEKVALPKKVYTMGSLQWDGRYLVAAIVSNHARSRSFDQLQISGGSITVAGEFRLHVFRSERFAREIQYWTQDRTIIGPDGTREGGYGIGLWNYPSGGNTTKLIRTPRAGFGVTISVAPSR